MGKLDDFTIDQLAGSIALVVSSLGGFMLIMFKSRCTSLCCGLCIREPLPPGEDEENPGPYQNANARAVNRRPQGTRRRWEAEQDEQVAALASGGAARRPAPSVDRARAAADAGDAAPLTDLT
jgi:hypothetical protein